MRKAKLKDLFDYLPKSKVKAGDGLEEGIYPFYTSSENQTKYLNEYQHGPGCLVFGTGGKASVHFTTCHFSTSTDCIAIKSKQEIEIDVGYVFQYFKGNMQVLENGFKGAGLKHISKAYLSDIQIPYPEDIDDQRRIAHLLGKVEGLIVQRKQRLQQLDDLLKGVFLEMFGDPVRNEKGWDTKTLPELVQSGKNALKRGPFGGALKKEIFVETGYLVYEQNHALNNDYSFARYFVSEEKFQELIDFKVVPGDVLISCSGVYLGKLSIVPANALPGIINQALLKVSLDPAKIEHRFFVHVFGSPQFKEKYFPSNRGGAIPNLPPMSVMKEIPFIYPPLKLQQDFTNIYQKVDALKSEYHQSLTNLEALYGALSQQAFKGELDLSRVPMPGIEPEEEKIVAAELLQIPAEKGLAI
ncbi:MAG: hypothetical protein RI902_500 [Pseudomonadota bacterium]|jgi:type I restriction enzyme S subunit